MEEKTNNILARLQADDRTALQEIFQLHYAPVCTVMRRIIPDIPTVEDLAQEVFLRFWQKRHQIQINTSLSAYLHRMAINEALGYLRRQRYFEEVSPGAESGDDASERVIHQELQNNIRQAVDRLPPKCRAVFCLSRFEERSYLEIAQEMGISVKTVENQMTKALKFLRQELRDYL